ncbi:hypothetical protein FJTKL_04806 [Diaporthe vaccinii]|uniref:Uncharacterized protein n=1 Tax=Diaporthe vaccinii TaxID=105482 RepID=A0ABR4DSD2_9PEZI
MHIEDLLAIPVRAEEYYWLCMQALSSYLEALGMPNLAARAQQPVSCSQIKCAFGQVRIRSLHMAESRSTLACVLRAVLQKGAQQLSIFVGHVPAGAPHFEVNTEQLNRITEPPDVFLDARVTKAVNIYPHLRKSK